MPHYFSPLPSPLSTPSVSVDLSICRLCFSVSLSLRYATLTVIPVIQLSMASSFYLAQVHVRVSVRPCVRVCALSVLFIASLKLCCHDSRGPARHDGQVESEASLNASAVEWHAPVRLRHLLTQMYLTIDTTPSLGRRTTSSAGTARPARPSLSLAQVTETVASTDDGDTGASEDRAAAPESDSVSQGLASPTSGASADSLAPLRSPLSGLSSVSSPVCRLTLTREPTEGSLFSLHPVIKEREAVEFGNYARIQHVQTHQWLHAEPSHPRPRGVLSSDVVRAAVKASAQASDRRGTVVVQEESEMIEKMRSIVWDPAPLVSLSLIPTCMFDDAFTITAVPSDTIYLCAYMAGIVPVLHQYCRDRRAGAVSAGELAKVTATVKELDAFLEVSGTREKQRQKLLRNFHIVDILIDMLRIPFAPDTRNALAFSDLAKPEHSKLKELCDAQLALLEHYLDGAGCKNALYVARHLPFLHQVRQSPGLRGLF